MTSTFPFEQHFYVYTVFKCGEQIHKYLVLAKLDVQFYLAGLLNLGSRPLTNMIYFKVQQLLLKM